MRGAAATGHRLTTEAACETLEKGGNAFDAAVAAGFAATAAEPFLTSLGGGGFLLAHVAAEDRDVLYDFFVDSPGKGLKAAGPPALVPVEVVFRSTRQVFHAGKGSVAVPGALKGLVGAIGELCSLGIDDIIAPALRYLDEGVEITDHERYLLDMLRPILEMTAYGKEIFGTHARRLYNPLLKEFLGSKSPEKWLDAVYGNGAGDVARQLRKAGGLVTEADLRGYGLVKRMPLTFSYRGCEVLSNPPPSIGGGLLEFSLKLLEAGGAHSIEGAERATALAGIMGRLNERAASGTTHISVVDSSGNAASMTCSNGSNSGVFIGSTGIMLNNMMGEDDLHPAGFHAMEPGLRVGSMMCPTIIKRGGAIVAALGSGGSRRIKTAMLQSVNNLLDRKMRLKDAIEAPRIHLDDDGVLQVEPGLPAESLDALRAAYRLNLWDRKDLYFGGVNAVAGDLDCHGDSRRGGSARLSGQQEPP